MMCMMAMLMQSALLLCLLTCTIADPSRSLLRAYKPLRGQNAAAVAAAAAAAEDISDIKQPAGHLRGLKQLGYDPYGFGYYDPYVAGVTPGLVNVDINRETGLHVDVGTVAVDVSADKNYYGVGVGNLVGIGAAKDRGWNLQVGGGNVVDVSVTKDAGLGLWLLNGLLNLNIGPDGRGMEQNIAARADPGQPVTPAAQDIASVVVDDPVAADSSNSRAAQTVGEAQPAALGDTAATNAFTVMPTPAAAAAAAEEPIITEEELRDVSGDSLDPNTVADVVEAPPPTTMSTAAYRSRTPSYIAPRPAVGATEGDALWSTAAQYSDTANVNAVRGMRPVPTLGATGTADPTAQHRIAAAAAGSAMAASAPRRACAGGSMVAVSGNKFKCKYKRPQMMQQTIPGVRTYPNGVAA